MIYGIQARWSRRQRNRMLALRNGKLLALHIERATPTRTLPAQLDRTAALAALLLLVFALGYMMGRPW